MGWYSAGVAASLHVLLIIFTTIQSTSARAVAGAVTSTVSIGFFDPKDHHVSTAPHTAQTPPIKRDDSGLCWPTASALSENQFQDASDAFCNFLRGLPLNASDPPFSHSYQTDVGNILFMVEFTSNDKAASATIGFKQCFDTTESIRDQCKEPDGQHGGRWFHDESGGQFVMAILPNVPNTSRAVKRDPDMVKRDHTILTTPTLSAGAPLVPQSRKLQIIPTESVVRERHEVSVDQKWGFPQGSVRIECGNGTVSTSAISILQNGGRFCGNVVSYPWKAGGTGTQHFEVNPDLGIQYHMEYRGNDGGLLADATCQSWMTMLTSQCPASEGGVVQMGPWMLFVVPYSGPSWGNWVFSKFLASGESKTLNISDFSGGTTAGAGNSTAGIYHS